MHKTLRHQRGQALVLIVFAIVGMIGLTGLAVDGGDAYSDRRHAQGAADTAVMAAALTKVRNPSSTGTWDKWSVAHDAAMQVAASNGYDNSGYDSNGTGNVVNVYHCDEVGASCDLPSGQDPKNYVQVTIESTIRTYFAPVLGIREMHNYVQAVAKAVDPSIVPWYDGNALVALMPGCKPNGWPDDPFTVSGTSFTLVNGTSGVFVNSNCDPAYTSSNNTTLNAPSVCVVGGVNANGTSTTAPQPGCGTQYDLQTYRLPPLGKDSCTSDGVISGNNSTGYIATPGNYSGSFPPGGGNGHLILTRGIYCLNGNSTALDINAGWDITTDVDGNGSWSDSYEGVAFYIPNGGVTINGGAAAHLSAMEDAAAQTAGVKGYLLYLPPDNHSAVNIAGGGSSALQGTILAPGAPISVSGSSSSDSFDLECQIIGYTVKLTGNGLVSITYNQSLNGMTMTNPLLQPYNSK